MMCSISGYVWLATESIQARMDDTRFRTGVTTETSGVMISVVLHLVRVATDARQEVGRKQGFDLSPATLRAFLSSTRRAEWVEDDPF